MKQHNKYTRILTYFLGMNLISVGVVLMLKSNLGNSSWDCLHYSLSEFLPITIGNATILVASIFTLFVIVLHKWDFSYLIMFIPILSVGFLIDFYNLYVFQVNEITNIYLQILSFGIGLALLPLGGSILLITGYPAGVFDEFMLSMMTLLKTDKMVLIRVIMELSAVGLAFYIGTLAGIGYGKIYYGTLIFSLSVGQFVKMYLSLFERMNLYENQQND